MQRDAWGDIPGVVASDEGQNWKEASILEVGEAYQVGNQQVIHAQQTRASLGDMIDWEGIEPMIVGGG